MPTINSKAMVDTITNNGGYYSDDPRVIAVVQYNNMFNGDVAYGLCYDDAQIAGYLSSGACRNAKTIWEARTVEQAQAE